jgi:hypothetical protein
VDDSEYPMYLHGIYSRDGDLKPIPIGRDGDLKPIPNGERTNVRYEGTGRRAEP